MTRSGKTEYAILGLLAMGSKTGYDIKREVQQTLGHFWNESYGNLYPVLRRLRRDGLVVRARTRSAKGPPRLVYSLTADGNAELRDWLRRPVDVIAPRNELLLKLFFGRFAGRGHLIHTIDEYRAQLTAMLGRLEHLDTTLADIDPQPPDLTYWRLTLAYGLRGIASVADWCDAAIARLQTLEDDR